MSTKDIAKKLFYDEGMGITEIAQKLNVSKQAISKHLIKDNQLKYEDEKKKERTKNGKNLLSSFFMMRD